MMMQALTQLADVRTHPINVVISDENDRMSALQSNSSYPP